MKQQTHLYGLDFVRFAAAMSVVLFHFQGFHRSEPLFNYEGPLVAFGWLEPVGWFGWVGVQVFFVLSGVVIAATAERSLPLQFAVKRAVRVLPALWVSATIALLVRLWWGQDFDRLVLPWLNAMVLSPKGPYIDGVVWTLVVEAVFYAVIALAILNDRRRGIAVSSFEKLAYLIGAASGLFLLLHGSALLLPGLPHAPLLAAYGERFVFDLALLRHGVFFALGMLLFVVSRRGLSPLRMAAMLVLALLGQLQIVIKAGFDSDWIVPCLVFLAALGVIVFSMFGSAARGSERIARISRPVGLLTYPLYLNHYTIGTFLVPMAGVLIADSLLLFVAMLALVLAISAFVTFGPERWLQSLAKNRLRAGGPELDSWALGWWRRWRPAA